MASPLSLSGTGAAPLAATRRYSFRRITGSAMDAHLVIPVVHRTSCEDLGEVERLEQQVFVQALLSELAVASRTGYPGEWLFEDAAALDRVWAALGERLRAPEKHPPRFVAHRALTVAEVPAARAALRPRFDALVQHVGGGPGEVVASEDDAGLTLSCALGDGREVSATASLGGADTGAASVGVVVSGVLDGGRLAEEFLGSL